LNNTGVNCKNKEIALLVKYSLASLSLYKQGYRKGIEANYGIQFKKAAVLQD